MNNILQVKRTGSLTNRPRIVNSSRDKFGTDSRLSLDRPVPSRGGQANGTPEPVPSAWPSSRSRPIPGLN